MGIPISLATWKSEPVSKLGSDQEKNIERLVRRRESHRYYRAKAMPPNPSFARVTSLPVLVQTDDVRGLERLELWAACQNVWSR